MENKVDVLFGKQWGDEGKGKVVDYLAPRYHIVARYGGGNNAGHTIWIDGKKTVLHTIPSGVFQDTIGLIGKNVLIDPHTLVKEMRDVSQSEIDIERQLKISFAANLILPTHRWLDKAAEEAKGDKKIGSTLKGIGPCYMDKYGRNALLFGHIGDMDKLRRQYAKLKEKHMKLLTCYPEVPFDIEQEEEMFFTGLTNLKGLEVVETFSWMQEQLQIGKRILAEGAQGALLDIDWGTYPYVTSSNTGTAGVQLGLGINHTQIGDVMGIVKAYTTRVGGGQFPTEDTGEIGEKLRKIGNEYGSTTGRNRRCGWIDVPLLRYAKILNGVKKVIVTKLDVLDSFETIKVCTHYIYRGERYPMWNQSMRMEEVTPVYKEYPGWNCDTKHITDVNLLPTNAINYIVDVFMNQLRIEVMAITNGPDRENFIPISRPGVLIDEPNGALVG